MEDLILPFCTTFKPVLGMNSSDILTEIDRLMLRQTAIDQVIHGELDDDVLYDLLAGDGINPHEWAEMAIENMDTLIERGQ